MKQCGNNSVSPVEEFDLDDSRAELKLQETANCQQNVKILKDHIRSELLSTQNLQVSLLGS